MFFYVIVILVAIIYLWILRHMKLSAEQKCDIATRELEELREEIERLKEESDKILDNYKVFFY